MPLPNDRACTNEHTFQGITLLVYMHGEPQISRRVQMSASRHIPLHRAGGRKPADRCIDCVSNGLRPYKERVKSSRSREEARKWRTTIATLETPRANYRYNSASWIDVSTIPDNRSLRRNGSWQITNGNRRDESEDSGVEHSFSHANRS